MSWAFMSSPIKRLQPWDFGLGSYFGRKGKVEGKLNYESMADAATLVSILVFAKQKLPACFL